MCASVYVSVSVCLFMCAAFNDNLLGVCIKFERISLEKHTSKNVCSASVCALCLCVCVVPVCVCVCS